MLLVSVVLDRQFIKDDRRSSLFYSFLIPPWQCFDRLVFTISMRTWIFQYRASIPAGEVAEKDLNINAPNHFLILNYRNGWSFDKNSNYILVFGRRLPPFPSKAAPGTGTNFIALHKCPCPLLFSSRVGKVNRTDQFFTRFGRTFSLISSSQYCDKVLQHLLVLEYEPSLFSSVSRF